jgi:hypothetical protein
LKDITINRRLKICAEDVARYSYHNWDSVGFFGIISDYYTPTKEDRIYEQMIQREILHFARTGKPYTDNWKTYPTNIGDGRC